MFERGTIERQQAASDRASAAFIGAADKLGGGDHVRSRMGQKVGDCRFSAGFQRLHVECRKAEVIVMDAMPFWRLGTVIMGVAEVVHPLAEISKEIDKRSLLGSVERNRGWFLGNARRRREFQHHAPRRRSMNARKWSYRPLKSCPDGSDAGRILRKSWQVGIRAVEAEPQVSTILPAAFSVY